MKRSAGVVSKAGKLMDTSRSETLLVLVVGRFRGSSGGYGDLKGGCTPKLSKKQPWRFSRSACSVLVLGLVTFCLGDKQA